MYKLPVIIWKNHGDEKYELGNIVNNIVITLYGDRYNYIYNGEYFVMHIIVRSLCFTSETNNVGQLYFN